MILNHGPKSRLKMALLRSLLQRSALQVLFYYGIWRENINFSSMSFLLFHSLSPLQNGMSWITGATVDSFQLQVIYIQTCHDKTTRPTPTYLKWMYRWEHYQVNEAGITAPVEWHATNNYQFWNGDRASSNRHTVAAHLKAKNKKIKQAIT